MRRHLGSRAHYKTCVNVVRSVWCICLVFCAHCLAVVAAAAVVFVCLWSVVFHFFFFFFFFRVPSAWPLRVMVFSAVFCLVACDTRKWTPFTAF